MFYGILVALSLIACEDTKTDLDTNQDINNVDSDNDGIPDVIEEEQGSNPNSADSDGDGIEDGVETDSGTDPTNPDSDGDGLNDGAEADAGTDPNNGDSDGDGVQDGAEADAGTDPNNADSDGDGLSDGAEVDAGTDPNTAEPIDPIILMNGTWSLDNVAVTNTSACNYSTLAAFGANINDFIPANYYVSSASETAFAMSVSSASIVCSITNNLFTCPSIPNEGDLNSSLGFDAVLSLNFNLSGQILTETTMGLTLDVEVTTCTGSECGMVGFLIPYPCTLPTQAFGTYVP